MKTSCTFALATLLAWFCVAAMAGPAPWFQWRSKFDGKQFCAQTSLGHGWEKAAGPYLDSHCTKLINKQSSASPEEIFGKSSAAPIQTEEKLMFTNPEQFASATKTLFELQMMTFNALTSKAVDGVEQVVALNMATAKNSVEGSMATGKEMSQAKDAKAAMAVAAAAAKPDVAGAVQYGEQLKVIIDDIHNEFTHAADAHIAEAKSTLSALIYDVTKNVKPGSENAVEIIKTAIDNAFQGYEQVTQATRQAVQVVEAQIAKATEQVVAKAKG